jgi:hypothetical protein
MKLPSYRQQQTLCCLILAVLQLSIVDVVAFVPTTTKTSFGISTSLSSSLDDGNRDSNNKSIESTPVLSAWKKFMATATMTAAVWAGPTLLADQFVVATTQQDHHHQSNMISNIIQHNFAADAREKASGTGSRVNKDPESLLRLGLPINNKEVSKKERKKRKGWNEKRNGWVDDHSVAVCLF